MKPTFQFSEFELDLERYELRRNRRRVKLEHQPLALLLLLVERNGGLVTQEEITERLWGQGRAADPKQGIKTAIRKIRSALGDDAETSRFIQTVIGQGYRFAHKVKVVEMESAAAIESAATPLLEVSPAQEAPAGPESPSTAGADAAGNSPRARRYWSKWRWLAVAILLCLFAGISTIPGSWTNRIRFGRAAGEIRALAVLPVVNLSGDAEQDYLADGLTDELIAHLARSTSLRVISRSSVLPYKNTSKPLPDIARELKVDLAVECFLSRPQGRIRIVAQLMDARTDRQLWAQTYERGERDVRGAHEAAAKDIAHQITTWLPNRETVQPAPRAINSAAYDAYLRGRFFWNRRTLDGLEKSIGYYRKAIEADSDYAEAYAALGESYALLSSYGGPAPTETLGKAQEAAEQALRFDPRSGQAHAVLAAVKIDRDWDWSGGAAEYRRAIELDPTYPTAYHWYSLHLSRMGDNEAAERMMQKALELDPLSLIINTDGADIAYCARNDALAESRLRRVLELDASFPVAHLVLGKLYELKGQYQEAVAAFGTATDLFAGSPNVLALQAHALALEGNRIRAKQMVADLEKLSAHRYVAAVDLGMVHCALRQPREAMEWFNRALERRDRGVNLLGADPVFDGCRADVGFQSLLRRLKLKE